MAKNKSKQEGGFMIQQQLINEETGEILFSEELSLKSSPAKLNGVVIKSMLENAKSVDDIDVDMLYSWCKITGDINRYGQFRILGNQKEFIDDKDKFKEELLLSAMTICVFHLAHNFSAILQKNRQTPIKTWSELYECIGCNSRGTQVKLKKFLESNHFVRVTKGVNRTTGKAENRFILNPFLMRGSCYSSQIAIMMFQDFIKEDVNMSSASVRLLETWGVIDIK